MPWDGNSLALNRFKPILIRLRHFNKPVTKLVEPSVKPDNNFFYKHNAILRWLLLNPTKITNKVDLTD